VKLHTIRRGLELPIAGAPAQHVEDAREVRTVGLLAADYPGMRPRFAVQVGDEVRRGQPLFEDRKNAGVRYTSPGAGRIAAIHRGERRALQSVVLELGASERSGNGDGAQRDADFAAFTGKPVAQLAPAEIRALLVESGQWTALRARPFGKVPPADSLPRSLFVTAIDTNPLAPDVDVALAGREDDFATGLAALVRLVEGRPVYLCRRRGSAIGERGVDGGDGGGGLNGVEIHEFAGPHPAGTPGLHVHRIDPVGLGRIAWHIGYQEVAAVGHLVRTGRLDVGRVVALAGPGVTRPRLLRTRFGASLDELTAGELAAGEQRVISGSILSGYAAAGPVHGYLGRVHNQVSVLPEDRERRFLHWLAPGAKRFSVLRLFASRFLPARTVDFTTDLGGGRRALVPVGAYERVLAFDLLITPLLRAMLAGDVETAEELGCLELAEEDVAPFTFVCPSKIDYGRVLRRMLNTIEREG
jgi:Na+-transporting NADH:ubiquinone oxidoreductase subunit A